MIRRDAALAATAILIHACGTPPIEPQRSTDVAIVAPTPTPDPMSGESVGSVESINGQWDIASFEGYQPQRLSGTVRAAFADFGNAGVSLRIECNYSGRAGAIRNGTFVPRPDDRVQTQMGCGKEREARDGRLFSFFNGSPSVEHVGEDRLRLRSGGRELVLERPAVRRVAFLPSPAELQGKWRMLELTRYEPGGGYSGSGLSEVPGRIVFAGDRLFYNRCPSYAVRFRYEPSGRLAKTGGLQPAVPPQDCRELAGKGLGLAMPGRGDVLALLHASPTVEKSGADALLISTARLGLLITKAPCETVVQSDDHRTTTKQDCNPPE